MEKKKQITDSISSKQVIGLIVACLLYIVVRLLPLNGLEPTGQKALAALAVPAAKSVCVFNRGRAP